MLESNISGLFSMSGNDDNESDYYYNYNNLQSRKNRQRKHYIESGYKAKKGIDLDVDTGEILNFIPKTISKMAYKKPYYKNSGVQMPDLTKFLPIAMYAAIGLLGYKLYHKFFGNDGSDIIDNKSDNGKKAVAALIVNKDQAKADSVKNTATSLLNKGLSLSSIHQTSANVLHDLLDSVWIDDDKIVKAILQQQIQTFRLVSVAYAIRELPTYTALHMSAFFTKENNFRGTLKEHLSFCLNDGSITKIHAYISVI